MDERDPGRRVAGIDGCPKGWIGALRRPGGAAQVLVLPRFSDFLRLADPPALIAVDIPIGLPERTGRGGRGPEALVRGRLGGRQSSVFAVPSRAAVYAPDYPAACRIARETSDPSQAVSKQCFHLFERIREVDAVVRDGDQGGDPAGQWGEAVYEAHPEVAFWRLNGGRALCEPKKVKGRPWPAGLAERRAILVRAGLPEALVASAPPRGAAADDLLDALANLLIAERLARGEARPHPDPPGRDALGVRVAIWA